jgi:cell division cycle 20, cofactor of APC complex
MERVAEIRDAHESRVLFSAIGPAGDMVVTGAGDENLKFWRIWDAKSAESARKKKDDGERRTNTTNPHTLAIR